MIFQLTGSYKRWKIPFPWEWIQTQPVQGTLSTALSGGKKITKTKPKWLRLINFVIREIFIDQGWSRRSLNLSPAPEEHWPNELCTALKASAMLPDCGSIRYPWAQVSSSQGTPDPFQALWSASSQRNDYSWYWARSTLKWNTLVIPALKRSCSGSCGWTGAQG